MAVSILFEIVGTRVGIMHTFLWLTSGKTGEHEPLTALVLVLLCMHIFRDVSF